MKINNKEVYQSSIHRVQDYIESNLHRNCTLEELAKVAGFSKYHFHRIFTSITKETVLQYTNRTRLENAALVLISNENLSITEIAHQYHFSDAAVFSRNFKKFYQMTPSAYRKKYRKNCKAPKQVQWYDESVLIEPKEDIKGYVRIEKMENQRVLYTRYSGSYDGLGEVFIPLFQELDQYGMKHHLLVPEQMKILAIYHENHEITTPDHLRTSLCITVPMETKIPIHDTIGCMDILGGYYAIGHFEIKPNQYPQIWNYMYGEWLWNSGYQLRDYFFYELYVNASLTESVEKHIVEIYIPIMNPSK